MIINASSRFSKASKASGKNRTAAQDASDSQSKNNEDKLEVIARQSLDNFFKDLHVKLSTIERKIIAGNFKRIVEGYDLSKPRYFYPYLGEDYETEASFRTVFGASKNPESKDIPAKVFAWKKLINLLSRVLKAKGTKYTAGILIHRLTIGTDFHPTKKVSDDLHIVLTRLDTILELVNEKYQLLDGYKDISNECTKLYGEYLRNGTHSKFIFDDCNIVEMLEDCKVDDYFDTDYLRSIDILGSDFYKLSVKKLKQLLTDAEEIQEDYLVQIRKDETSSTTNTLKVRRGNETITFYADEYNDLHYEFVRYERLYTYIDELLSWRDKNRRGIPEPIFEDQLNQAPHAFLGVFLGNDRDAERERGDGWSIKLCQKAFKKFRNINPMLENVNYKHFLKKSYEGIEEYGHVFLVLYPNKNLTKLAPYIAGWAAEGSYFKPLNEDFIASMPSNFLHSSYPKGNESTYNSLIDLLKDPEYLVEEFKRTGNNLKYHFVLKYREGLAKNDEASFLRACEDLSENQ